ncbi:magnesium transporter CorA family protein [Siminovitchia terrae]|uniref:Magnesium transporter CorA family protein n=1 Tax=Siminovitchia terrae TaxID=1914933 RepID=A0A429X8S5_SIMTE|nr:magnesium transporter CorA family protein [Siminovitchia terrae]RST59827.1 magnesium transporter CorA family protein [Siminovitchia terrae]
MLLIYKSTSEGKLEKRANITNNSWLHLVKPTSKEIDHMVKELAIPRDFIIDSLDIDERPRIEERDGAVLIVIHVPYDQLDVKNSNDDVKYRTIPMGIIHTKDHMITICNEEIPFMKDIFNSRVKDFATHMKTRNTLKILNVTAQAYIRFLATIEHEIALAEKELAKSYRNREMYTLLYLNESLIYMVTSLKQMKFTMQKILHGDYIKLYEDDADILDDVLIELAQAYEITEINQDNLNNVMDAYANVVQNNVNRVLKLLAAFTIILSVPMLIASIYGMNVPLPFQDLPNAFWGVMTFTFVLTALCAFVFYKKQYFAR